MQILRFSLKSVVHFNPSEKVPCPLTLTPGNHWRIGPGLSACASVFQLSNFGRTGFSSFPLLGPLPMLSYIFLLQSFPDFFPPLRNSITPHSFRPLTSFLIVEFYFPPTYSLCGPTASPLCKLLYYVLLSLLSDSHIAVFSRISLPGTRFVQLQVLMSAAFSPHTLLTCLVAFHSPTRLYGVSSGTP